MQQKIEEKSILDIEKQIALERAKGKKGKGDEKAVGKNAKKERKKKKDALKSEEELHLAQFRINPSDSDDKEDSGSEESESSANSELLEKIWENKLEQEII